MSKIGRIELISSIKKSGVSNKEANEILDNITEIIGDHLLSGGAVSLPTIGVIKGTIVSKSTGIVAGKETVIPKYLKLTFKSSSIIKNKFKKDSLGLADFSKSLKDSLKITS